MKNANKYILFCFIIIFQGCFGSKKDAPTGDSPPSTTGTNTDTNTNPEGETLILPPVDEIEVEVTEEGEGEGEEEEVEVVEEENNQIQYLYSFDFLDGLCKSELQERGYNIDLITQCGGMSGRVIDDPAINSKGLWGINLLGSQITPKKVNLFRLTDYEARISGDTSFQSIHHPFTTIFTSHVKIIHREEKRALKYQANVHKYTQKLRGLMDKWKDTEKERKKARLEKQIIKTKAKINKYSRLVNISLNKKVRHARRVTTSYDLATKERPFEKMDIKNQKWLKLSKKQSYQFLNGSELNIDKNNFAISLWFRTEKNQHESRLINIHKTGKAGSAFNLSLKKGKVILGISDGKKYISIECRSEYDDENWHQVIGSYQNGVFKLFVDGDLEREHKSKFAGFGTFPSMIGSFNGKGHFFEGEIDELSIWSTGVDQQLAAELYNNGKPSKLLLHPNSVSLQHWWRMGDGQKEGVKIFNDRISKLKLEPFKR
ncbi:MAG: LamG domain-containing protein [Bacteriovoracaceae bacterium]|jgi:hypothetical protein|nr:LamG domain-containing protein [Bacteriovoracaceae bacterium]